MERRSFLQLLGIGSATAAFPALAGLKDKGKKIVARGLHIPNTSIGGEGFDIGRGIVNKPVTEQIKHNDNFVHIKRIDDLSRLSDSERRRIIFTKAGYDDVIKNVRVSRLANMVAKDDKIIKIELAYQTARQCKEAYHDYLYMEYGKDWQKFNNFEPQYETFLQDLERLEKQSMS